MKKLLLVTAILSSVSAFAWYCESHSSQGTYGWGSSPYLHIAQNRALNNCRAVTHFSHVCYTPVCR